MKKSLNKLAIAVQYEGVKSKLTLNKSIIERLNQLGGSEQIAAAFTSLEKCKPKLKPDKPDPGDDKIILKTGSLGNTCKNP